MLLDAYRVTEKFSVVCSHAIHCFCLLLVEIMMYNVFLLSLRYAIRASMFGLFES
jgi:hypothetical protein